MSFTYNFTPKISMHGVNVILISLAITIGLSFISVKLACFGLFITVFVLYFFRDPERLPIDHDGAIISPADGLITYIGKVEIPKKFGIEGEAIKISIFLDIFDIHVNRAPVNGIIKNVIYSPGKFVSATNDKESEDNESNTLIIEDKNGNNILVTQIAGLVARRIVCTKKSNDNIQVGDRFGIIKFGSRVNIYLPTNFKLFVKEGQRMTGGETLMAINDKESLDEIFNQNII